MKMAYNKSTSDLLKKSLTFHKHYLLYLSVPIILMIISVVLSVYAPKLLGKIINDIFNYTDPSEFNMVSIFDEMITITVLYTFSYLLRIPVNRILSKMSERVTANVKSLLYKKLDKIPVYEFSDEYTGNIMARLNNDTATIKSFISKKIAFILSNDLVIIAVIIMIIPMKYELSLLFLISLPVYLILIILSYIKTKDYYKDFQDDLGQMMGFMGDYLSNRYVVKLFNAKDYINNRFIQFNDRQRDNFFKSRFYSEVNNPIYLLLSYVIQILVYLYAGYFVYTGVVSFGEFSTFVLYVQMFRKPMMSFSHSVNSIKGYFACIDRVCEIIDYPVDDENPEIGLNDDEITGEIEFKNISYNNMSEFNLKIASGEIINVVGKNQYDLVDLLLNFSKPDCGEILLDGVDIRKLNFNEYRKIFGVSIEDDQIMSASIAQNISLGGNDVDIDDVKEICERLGISKIIERFPDGYDTSISDDSISLSSGERKLICVARALISNPKILILNYPNYLSQDILKKVIEGKTTILLTPDEDTINFADKTISIK